MKVAFYTLGCKVNSYETEAVLEKFKNSGYEIVNYEEFSDIYVVNSCMVTNAGEKKSKQIIRRPLKLNPQAIVIVMGCLTQLKADEILKIPGVKIVLGTKNRDKIVDYLEEYLTNKKTLNKVTELEKKEEYDSLAIIDFENHKRAFIKIQDGCNNFCTYCIIPYTRGRVRSKSKDTIIDEVKHLVGNGHIEVVLTGIHTGGYGADLKDYSLVDLLKDLEKIQGLKRIRISSIEISEISDSMLETIAKSEKIVHHLHVPLQSGSDKVLKNMNRKYTTNEYRLMINHIRKAIPDVAFTTDVIVGFPGETATDFEEAYNFIKSVGFQELHVFPFSRRKGTPADKMLEQIDTDTKKLRVHRLIKLSEDLKKDHILNNLGTIHYCIAEQIKNGYLVGHTRDYISVKFIGDKSLLGKEVRVKLLSYDNPYTLAKIEKK
ncbi:MAG: tRNA (N(6)-L-threonylcarbamoyladenosine(37)-C(2))-methylthiotransferase MtaB [Candidatus Izemoplasmatales bacterium]